MQPVEQNKPSPRFDILHTLKDYQADVIKNLHFQWEEKINTWQLFTPNVAGEKLIKRHF